MIDCDYPFTCRFASCDFTCSECSANDDPNSCTSCDGELYLSENSCLSECPDNFIAVDDTNTCDEYLGPTYTENTGWCLD